VVKELQEKTWRKNFKQGKHNGVHRGVARYHLVVLEKNNIWFKLGAQCSHLFCKHLGV
jgi:hypothetical protein